MLQDLQVVKYTLKNLIDSIIIVQPVHISILINSIVVLALSSLGGFPHMLT